MILKLNMYRTVRYHQPLSPPSVVLFELCRLVNLYHDFNNAVVLCIFSLRRKCFSGGGNGPAGPLVQGAVEEE